MSEQPVSLMVSLLSPPFAATLSVSSVSDAKEFGKKALTDGRDDTCWSSGEVMSLSCSGSISNCLCPVLGIEAVDQSAIQSACHSVPHAIDVSGRI